MRYLILALISTVLSSQMALADEYLPGMDVLLFAVNPTEAGVNLKLVQNVSNNKGYDNQPSFSADNQQLTYASMRDGLQTDIYAFDISTKKTKQLTKTPHSEYSPILESETSLIAVREGGDPYQSVHRYDLNTGLASWAVSTHTPIGYYAFNADGIAAAWGRWANALYLVEPNQAEATFVIGHVPPSKPHLIPNSNSFSFVHRQADDTLWIKSLNPENLAVTPIAPALNNNIDYAWTPEGAIIAADNALLYRWSLKHQSWELWADLSKHNIGSISRLAVSNNFKYVAVVARVKK